MKIIKIFYVYFFLPSITLFSAPDLTISTPGLYRLGNFISSTIISTPDSIISIQANDVILDLAGYVVQQTNATASITGITIGTGLTNVTIRNGTIKNTTLNGITINSGCSNITIENITFQGCQAIGIAAASSGINIKINNCLVTNGSTTGPFGIQLTGGCSECQVTNTIIKNCGSGGIFFSPFRLDCIDSLFIDLIVEDCTGSSVNAFEMFNNFQRNRLVRCIVRNNSTTSSLNGFILNNTANVNDNIFEDCKCLSNSISGALAGFSIIGAAIQNTLKNCIVNGNSSTSSSIGFFCNGNKHQFVSCIVANNNVTAGTIRGFDLENCNDGLVLLCVVHNNTCTTTGQGIFITACNTWTFQDNYVLRNSGGSDAQSFGIVVDTTTNLFTRNIAFRNGVTIANQLSGLGATQLQNNSSQLMNSNTLPWTNLAIAT